MPSETSSLIIFLVSTTAIVLLLAGVILSLLLFYQRRQLNYQKSFAAMKAGYEQMIMATKLEIQEETFQNISREIHDNIGLSLTLAKLHLNTLDMENKNNIVSQVNKSVELLSESISNLRNISKSLNSDVIAGYGLIKAIELEVDRISSANLFKVYVSVRGNPVFLSVQKDLIVFRIIQEAFNNIIKHSGAKKIHLKLEYFKDFLKVFIKDDGNGFMLSEVECSIGKAGLNNMNTRVTALNGKMDIKTAIGKGTLLQFTIPF